MKSISRTLRATLLTLCAAVLTMLAAAVPLQAQDLDVPYVPTPQLVVDRMLELADVKPGDYVIDLGSGDGRIVISAARMGAMGHGIDLDPERVEEARENAAAENVTDRVMFLREDIFETDFSDANVITMYLLTSVNRKLRPRLLETLEPGTRIVSHSFDMGEWEPDVTESVETQTGSRHTIYYWVIPARIDGSWSWTVGKSTLSAQIDQRFQEISVSVNQDGSAWTVEEASLHGERLSLIITNGSLRYVLSGRASGGTVDGTAQIHQGDTTTKAQWTGTRN
ncbi:MAG: class I SAM-dependent methyltransferase [Balneolaceae bacterium]|nr:class I SAM-dependent methyltransferase [Balneolaceae bacterium]